MVGEVGAGKSTLIHAIQNTGSLCLKTQAPEYVGHFIDTPGEYLQNPYYRIRLMSLAQGCCCVLFIQDCTREALTLPPKFTMGFLAPVLGVITKSDLGDWQAYIKALKQLHTIGVEKVFLVSSVTGSGLDKLQEMLSSLLEPERVTCIHEYRGKAC